MTLLGSATSFGSTRNVRHRAALLASAALLISGCQHHRSVQLDKPELAAFVRLVMPARLEIQRYLTRPCDFAGGGDADGLEVILTTLDSSGDPVKCLGTFHFELHTVRLASADKLGKLVARWSTTVGSSESLAQYWDRSSRYYRFPLKLAGETLAPGRYVLSAWLITPTDEKLFDDYEFTHGPS